MTQNKMAKGKSCFVKFDSTDIEAARILVDSICKGLAGSHKTMPNAYIFEATTDTSAWGLDRSDSLTIDGEYCPAYRGRGNTAYVIDSGSHIDHEEFEGRASYGFYFVSRGTTDSDDDSGHETHCAGTTGSKNFGIAKMFP